MEADVQGTKPEQASVSEAAIDNVNTDQKLKPEVCASSSGDQELSDESVTESGELKESAKDNLIGFFTRPLLSKKKTDELNQLVDAADALHQRIDETESTIKEIGEAVSQSHRMMGKALRRIFKDIEKAQASQERSIERIISELRSDYAAQASGVKQYQSAALAKIDDAAGTISGVNGSLTGIRGFLDENNKLVKRFEEGYDYQILKNFVRQIARTISNLDAQIPKVKDEGAREELIDARDDLVEMLDRSGVEQISPAIGSAYAGMEKYAEVAQEKVSTDDSSKRGAIAVIDRVGYKYEFNDGQERVIQPARIKLFE